MMSLERLPSLTATVTGSTTGGHGPTPPRSKPLLVGSTIGRHVVLAKLGAGAMGVVYAAYDPELDRKVAIKVLKARGDDSQDARARLLREAQALARLDHPNVVTIYDVGTHEQQLFLSMEFIEGQTLGQWMRGAREPGQRPWREVLDKFLAAGRGLAAAHAAGLIHRDFKPDNVMLGDDGRVRVMDFGLACSDEDSPLVQLELAQEHAPTLLTPLTMTGRVLGTPAYMALEQFSLRQATARSDQFGFCTALYEALHGERPYAGSRVGELLLALQTETIRAAPKHTRVPSWVRNAVLRGLARDPDARWPSMGALLAALSKDPAARRRKWASTVLSTGLVLGAIAGAWSTATRAAQSCANTEHHLAEVWDAPRRAQLEQVFDQAELVYAAHTWKRVESQLDHYAEAWQAARREACEATARGEQSGELLDLRMACLDQQLVHLQATVDLLGAADEAVVTKAVETVGGLPRIEDCANIEALTSAIELPRDPRTAEEVEVLSKQLARASVHLGAGKFTEAIELASPLTAAAADLDYEPLLVRVLLLEGRLHDARGDYEQAETTLRRAYSMALALGMLPEAGGAATGLTAVVGFELARHREGRRWAEDAEPLSRADGSPDARASYFNSLATVAMSEGAYTEAEELFERSRLIWERDVGPDSARVANALTNLGTVAHARGDYAKARVHLERALAIWEATLGPHHPDVAYALSNLGVVAEQMGATSRARAYHQRALLIFEQALEPEHTVIATTLNNLGMVAKAEGDLEGARAYLERSLHMFEQTLEADHPSVAKIIANLGTVASLEQAFPQAQAYHQRALEIRERALGPEHPKVASSLVSLGELAAAQGDLPTACAHYERARGICERGLDPHHPAITELREHLRTCDVLDD